MQKLTDASLERKKRDLEAELNSLVPRSGKPVKKEDEYPDATEFVDLVKASHVRETYKEMRAAFIRAVENIAFGVVQEERRIRSRRRSQEDPNQTNLF